MYKKILINKNMKKIKKLAKSKVCKKNWKMSVSNVEKNGCLINSD